MNLNEFNSRSGKKDILIGFVIIAVIITSILLFKKYRPNQNNKPSPTTPSQTIEFKKEFENNFRYSIPENVNAIELQDVSGGDARGIATENEILVDAKDPEQNYFYEAWLEKDGNLVTLGKLNIAKGGWLLEYDKSKYDDKILPDSYKKIIISLETKLDNKIEKRILEGSFN